MRNEFSRKTKLQAWARCEGHCEAPIDPRYGWLRAIPGQRCQQPLGRGGFHYDHIDPDWVSGRNDLANCQVICIICHNRKTAADAADIAKVKRIRDKLIKAKTTRRKLPGGKSDWRKKKLDGTVVDRRTGKPV